MYITRQITNALMQTAETFPAIMLTGPRQSGKTTLLKNIFPRYNFISLDEPDTRLWASEDPRGFLEDNKQPLIIDEIQYLPQLLSYIKASIDSNRAPGQWILTGSQQFSMMKNVSETLAGRVAIMNLMPFSMSERKKFIYSDFSEWFAHLKNGEFEKKDVGTVITSGSFPELVVNKKISAKIWYDSYIQTYLERDLKAVYDVGNLNTFYKFLTLLAARTGQVLNYSGLAGEVGVTMPTVKKWISILEAGGIIFLLPPYFKNIGKRLLKSPKVYFIDPGLAAHLAGISEGGLLMKSHLAGSFFETLVVSEFIKNYYNTAQRPPLYYINNKNIWEVDLLIEANLELIPLEIKLSGTISGDHFKNFVKLREAMAGISKENYLVCMYNGYLFKQNTNICNWNNL